MITPKSQEKLKVKYYIETETKIINTTFYVVNTDNKSIISGITSFA